MLWYRTEDQRIIVTAPNLRLCPREKKNQSYEVIEHRENFTWSGIHSCQEFPSVMLFTIKNGKSILTWSRQDQTRSLPLRFSPVVQEKPYSVRFYFFPML